MSRGIKLLLFLTVITACSNRGVEAIWYEGNPYTVVIRNLPHAEKDWTVWFSTPALKKLVVDTVSTAEMLEVEGNFYKIVPSPSVPVKGDSVGVTTKNR